MKEIKDVSELAGLPVGTEVKFGDLEFSVEVFDGEIAGSVCPNCVIGQSRGNCAGVPCGDLFHGFVYLPITKKAEQSEYPNAEYHTSFIAQNPKNIETARGLLVELMNTETDKDKQIILQKIYKLI